MIPTAVTEDASAVSEREPSSTLMPTDKHYRLTGEMPEKLDTGGTQRKDEEDHIPQVLKDEEEKQSAASGDKDDVKTASASEAVPQKELQQKTAQTSESRWQKITRENRELRDRLARVEGAQSAQPRETQQASQPVAENKGRPTATDKDPKTGEPLYKTWQELTTAQENWLIEEATRKANEAWDKKAHEQTLQQAEERIQQEINKRTEQARKDHPDYDDTISELLARKTPDGKELIFFPKGSAVDMFFAESPKSQDIFYEIGKNPDKYAEIFAHDAQGKFIMHPVRQLRLLAQIEGKLDSPKAEIVPPAKPVTAAGRPPHQVSGKGTVAKDAVAQAVEDGDSEAYIRETNARELARRKKG